MATTDSPRRAASKYNPTGQDVDIITTVNGGATISWAIHQAGGLVGYESKNNRPPGEIPVDFVDWPFRKGREPSFEEHLQVVKRERPMYAVAPDIEGDIELSLALEYADELSSYASIVIVVPKDVKPSAIPDEYRVGIPCQSKFGGSAHSIWDYRSCEQVHLLGGSPRLHKEIQEYVSVRSLDTASVVKSAQFGSSWGGVKWESVDRGFYGNLQHSISNLIKQWNGGMTTFATERIKSLDLPDDVADEMEKDPTTGDEKLSLSEIPTRWLEIEYPSELAAIEDRIKPEENPFPPSDLIGGPGEKVPFPGRAAFYEAQ